MLYLAQLQAAEGSSDDDFWTLKSWVFESDDPTLDKGWYPEQRIPGQPGFMEQVQAAVRGSDARYEHYYIRVNKVEQVDLGAAPVEALTKLAVGELQDW